MKSFKFLILFISMLAASAFWRASAQCLPTITLVQASNSAAVTINPASGNSLPFACIDGGGSNSTKYIATVTHSSCPKTPVTPTLSLVTTGGIELIGAAPNPNLNATANTSTIRFRSKNGSLCRGRLTFTITYPSTTLPGCTTSCSPLVVGPPVVIPGGSFSASIDLSKTITSYAPIAGPSCVTPGATIVWSVDPKLQCPSDGLGVDPIVWERTNTDAAFGNTVWTSLDNPTSLTYQIPSTLNTPTAINLQARVGRCPVGNPNSGFLLPTLGIFRQAGPTWLTTASNRVSNLGGNQVYVGINTVPAGSVTCNSTTIALNGSEHNGLVLPINTNPLTLPVNQQQQQIVLTAQGNGPADVGDLGIKFQFSPPSNAGDGFTWIQGSSTAQNQNPQFTLTTANFLSDDFLKGQVSGLYNNATGTYSVLASSPNGCTGATGGSYRIFRYMVPPAAGVTPPLTRPNAIAPERYNYIINASGPNGTGVAPRACYRGNEAAEILILQNAPTGPFARFTWTAPNGWVLNSVAGNGASELTGAGTNVMTGLNLVSVSLRPTATAAEGKVSVNLPPPVYPNSTVSWCNVPNPTIQYPFTGDLKGASTTVKINGTDVTYAFTANAPTGSAGNTSTNVTVSPTNLFTATTCSGPAFDVQFQFKGVIYNSASDRNLNINGTPSAANGTDWSCSSTFFPNTTYCPISNTEPQASTGNWLNLTGNSLNIAFRSGKYYRGAYRFRIRSTGVAGNACAPFDCFLSEWREFPASGDQNWRVATEAEWDGGPDLESFGLYPNPASASVMLTIPEGEKGQYQIVNMQGQVVMQGSVTQTGTELKTSGLPKGIYTLKFTGKQFSSQKLVIE